MDYEDLYKCVMIVFMIFFIFSICMLGSKAEKLKEFEAKATELGYARYETDGKTIQFIWNKPNDLNEPNNPKGEIE